MRRLRAMGLAKKIEKEPPLRIRDCRKAISIMGPTIMARINGAISYCNFRNTYPKIPEARRTHSSKMLILVE